MPDSSPPRPPRGESSGGGPAATLTARAGSSDDRNRVGRRSRRELAPEYARRDTSENLDVADLAPIVAALATEGTAALFCVERDPAACHRSLVARRLTERHGITVEAPAARLIRDLDRIDVCR